MRARVAPVVLALLVVAAGCSVPGGPWPADGGPSPASPGTEPTISPPDSPDAESTTTGGTASTADSTTADGPTPTPRTSGKVIVEGRALSFEPGVVYRRVAAMHGLDPSKVSRVRLVVKDRADPSRTSQVWRIGSFERLWGIDPADAPNTSIAGLAVGRTVYLYADVVETPRDREAVLAHEFAHVVQIELGARRQISEALTPQGNVRRVYVAVVEGTATYAQQRYLVRYADGSPRNWTWASVSRNRSLFGTYAVAPYYFGHRYVEGRADSARDLEAIYENPPTTTEQIIHGYRPGEEPPRPLSVEAAAASSPWDLQRKRTKGELFVRVIFEGQLSRERAADAAAGWGADRVLSFRDGDRRGHAWVLRWDDPGEADEFAAALTDYLDRRASRQDGGWRDGEAAFDLRRVGDETVVVLAGDPGFVDDAAVEGTDGDVTVRVEG